MTLESSPALTVTAPAGGFVAPKESRIATHRSWRRGGTTCSGGDEAVKALPGAEDAVPVDEVEEARPAGRRGGGPGAVTGTTNKANIATTATAATAAPRRGHVVLPQLHPGPSVSSRKGIAPVLAMVEVGPTAKIPATMGLTKGIEGYLDRVAFL